MKKYKQLTLVLLIIIISGCSSVQVSQDYDITGDFPQFTTYDWRIESREPDKDPRGTNSLIEARIRKTVDRLLLSKGYQRVTDNQVDIYLSYIYRIERRFERDDYYSGVGFGMGTYGRHGGFGIGTGSIISDYDQSVLAIDFIDASSGQLIWRGMGTRRVFFHSNPEQITKNINETVEKILSQFPPGVKK